MRLHADGPETEHNSGRSFGNQMSESEAMKQFKNILVLYNGAIGADDALTEACALAKANTARITLIDVVPMGQAWSHVLADRKKRLSRVARAVQHDVGRPVEVCVRSGPTVEQVIRQVLDKGHDIVLASSIGRTGVQNAEAASLATQLMRECPCPVLIVKPKYFDTGELEIHSSADDCEAPARAAA